jgi:hypothetical protein
MPVVLTLGASLRLLLGELILVEWLFAWPGLGRLLALALIPPRIALTGGAGDESIYFLHPPLLAWPCGLGAKWRPGAGSGPRSPRTRAARRRG